MKSPPVYVLEEDMTHHGRHSGYARLAEYLNARRVSCADRAGINWIRLHRRVMARGCASRYYWVEYLRFECLLAARSWLPGRRLAHLFYGENQFWMLARWRRRAGLRVVATFHQPEATRHLLVTSDSHWDKLDGIVALCDEQAQWLRRVAPTPRIAVVPHGIDTTFFTPGDPPRPGPPWRVTVVGGWLRDFTALTEVVRRLTAATPQRWHFELIIPQAEHARFAGLPVVLHSRLSDEELRAVHRSAHLLFLPLLHSTANNGLLESLACGTPVVANRTGGVAHYASPDCVLVTDDATPAGYCAALEHAATNWCSVPDRLRATREAARRQAQRFAWPEVARQMEAFYADVLGAE